jgi:iron complex transport system substrate-binding protein
MRRFSFAAAIAASLVLFPCAGWTDPITVTDLRGTEIMLPGPAERLAIIPIPMASVVMALDGSTARIAAMNPAAITSVTDGFLGQIYPEAVNIPSDIIASGQFAPNVEAIIAHGVDVVIQWKTPEDIIAPLEAAGLPVIGLQNDPATQALNEQNLTVLARVIGQEARLQSFLALHHARQPEIAAAIADIADNDRPSVLYLRVQEGQLRAAGTKTYRNFWITLAGGRNAAAGVEGQNEVNAEQIIAWNPDVILLSAFDPATPAEIYANPAFANLAAVQNRRVYKVPHGGYRWDPASHESHLAWTWAAMLFHPEVTFDLHGDMRSAYELFYGHTLTAAEIDAILRVDLNADSAGYDRFRAQ